MWDNRLGTLRGDRPHAFKVYGSYFLPWNASAGFYTIAQSGQPWESWSFEPYRTLTTSTTDTNRFAEPAGSRRTPSHAQLDLKYIQNIPIRDALHRADRHRPVQRLRTRRPATTTSRACTLASFGAARNFFDPRRVQVAFRLNSDALGCRLPASSFQPPAFSFRVPVAAGSSGQPGTRLLKQSLSFDQRPASSRPPSGAPAQSAPLRPAPSTAR